MAFLQLNIRGRLILGFSVLCILLAGVIGTVLALRLINSREGRSHLVRLLALPVVSALAWFGFFYVIYGTPSPSAPYGTYTQSALANILNGLPAL